jgi:hypothetical protein
VQPTKFELVNDLKARQPRCRPVTPRAAILPGRPRKNDLAAERKRFSVAS